MDREEAVNEFFDKESSLSVKPITSQAESLKSLALAETTIRINESALDMEQRPAIERINGHKAEGGKTALKDVGRTKTVPIDELHTNSPSKIQDLGAEVEERKRSSHKTTNE